jgi:hypothetical protein
MLGAFAQGGLGPPSLGDVARDAKSADDPPAGITQWPLGGGVQQHTIVVVSSSS